MDLKIFSQVKFLPALKALFKSLNVPMNYVANEPTTGQEILKDTYKENESFQLMDDVYFVGMVDDAAFEDNESLEVEKIKSDYDGILIFGVTLKNRPNGLLPTRSQLAEISRAFNREFYYTPVVVVFKYGNYLAFANTERLKYKQEWREGEKAGKVSLLRDINIENPHSGHERILAELEIPTTGTKKVDSFDKLYIYWQEVFSVSLLNKKFYQELSNWYFWARDEVKFPNEPLRIDYETDEKYDEAINEHNGKNVIRLLTRILFVWFIKEKGLIPNEIFDENFIVENLIEDFEPQKPQGIFATGKHTSKYYRAILQNLFFATLNCEKGKRQFRRDGDHQNVTYLMRYQTYFKNSDLFLEIMESKVPFMNGGLFDCLDKVHPNKKGKRGGDIIIYQDGFSDKDSNVVSVPDYLFFDKDEIVDLSKAYGQTKYKKVNTKGLLKILESYKFTITENTPIEEDVALDPELLGRVFENLLASYNPETKTTARKQTGSFYTPREIVNYMVDESLIAYLKNTIPVDIWGKSDKEIDSQLRALMSFDNKTHFEGSKKLKKEVIKAIDNCKILDPACGSGAFPMGVLQKMVHVLHKIDPNNEEWQQRQLDRIDEAVESLDQIEDAEYRDRSIKELKEQKKDIKRAFDNNELDYGRKLYLIENCIYGVDIQSIAVQISKLRFFISLIVDQHINKDQENFGIRPLPNLETKFVAANTLIGIRKPDGQYSFFDNDQVKELEQRMKTLNKKLFSIKSPSRKREIREEMKTIRNQMTEILEDDGLDNKTARTLAKWDPFDQNASSPFFDPEWMFDINGGFHVVIGNPPYVKESTDRSVFNGIRKSKYYQGKIDLWYFFACIGIDFLSKEPKGILSFIATNNWTTNSGASILRNKILQETKIKRFVDFSDFKIFESAGIQTMVFLLEKNDNTIEHNVVCSKIIDSSIRFEDLNSFLKKEDDSRFIHFKSKVETKLNLNKTISFSSDSLNELLNQIESAGNFKLISSEINSGIDIPQDFLSNTNKQKLGSGFNVGDGVFVLSNEEIESLNLTTSERELLKPFYTTNELYRYNINQGNRYRIIYTDSSYRNPKSLDNYPNIKSHLNKFQSIITSENKPYGLNRARNEKFFLGERIVVQRKCPIKPSFVYVNFDAYFNRTFLPILTKRINLKYLASILNSSLVAFWLRHKGKMQGDNYQVDKDPVLSIPVKLSEEYILLLSALLEICICSIEKSTIENIIDSIVFNLYFPNHMKERGIDVLEFVERDIAEVMQGREFEKLSESKKEQIIEELHTKWSHPENEVVKRMAMFKEKSPDILKVILES